MKNRILTIACGLIGTGVFFDVVWTIVVRK